MNLTTNNKCLKSVVLIAVEDSVNRSVKLSVVKNFLTCVDRSARLDVRNSVWSSVWNSFFGGYFLKQNLFRFPLNSERLNDEKIQETNLHIVTKDI